jgi:hypothetical protein
MPKNLGMDYQNIRKAMLFSLYGFDTTGCMNVIQSGGPGND